MQGYRPRWIEGEVERRLATTPVVAILGPRQCGKSTLARHLLASHRGAVHLDLERPSDLRRLADPEAFFALHREDLVCLDEVQRVPELFPVLRGMADERDRPGQLLILGSASPELLRQSSESLAGRIAFLELTPFLLPEVAAPARGTGAEAGDQGTAGMARRGPGNADDTLTALWLRGGFPRSFLAADDAASFEWRSDFVRSFLERDLRLVAPRIAPERLGSFWRMCAHVHGQVVNAARLGAALGVSGHTVRGYLELLEHTFILRLLPPLEANLGKRLVRSPRLLLRDSGILHCLLEVASADDLLGHPARGSSWEGLVIEHAIAAFRRWRPSFYRTQVGAELDLVLERGGRVIAVEAKASSAPAPTRGFWSALADLGVEQAFVVAPIAAAFPLGPRAAALPLGELLAWAARLDAGERHPALGRER